MDQQNPQCSRDVEEKETLQGEVTEEIQSGTSKEICTKTLDLNIRPSSIITPRSFTIASKLSYNNNEKFLSSQMVSRTSMPLIIMSRPPSLIMRPPAITNVVALQPQMPSNLPSPLSLASGQPQTLFHQALEKLNESTLSNAITEHFKNIQIVTDPSGRRKIIDNSELSPPDSLTSAPPSYSFVLRQMTIRRRPRIVGTFIPSPSFVQHTPPPNYTAAFDIYVDNPMPPAPRIYNFGFTSMPVVCPDCGYTGMTMVTSKITICTHLCAIVLCILCCWVCAPLPYILRSCKDVYHYCRNCRNFLGMYCPTNPENTYN